MGFHCNMKESFHLRWLHVMEFSGYGTLWNLLPVQQVKMTDSGEKMKSEVYFK